MILYLPIWLLGFVPVNGCLIFFCEHNNEHKFNQLRNYLREVTIIDKWLRMSSDCTWDVTM